MAGQEGGHFLADVRPTAEKQVPALLDADQPGAGEAATCDSTG